jgi:replicative DNA helicase
MSGMGKTTFALQVADNLAQTGHDVLYVSLEMSKMDLSAKSVSRRMLIASASTFGVDASHCMTTDQILTFVVGDEKNDPATESLFVDAKRQQRQTAKRLFIRNERWGVSEIEKDVAEFTKSRISPVLMIDYLQQLKASNARNSDKQNIDSDISRIKEIAMKYNIPVIVISSLNRLAYYKPVTVDAFKESGSIEYSADCLLALQLYGVGPNDNRTMDQYQMDMAKYPRVTELVILKERNRPAYDRKILDYYTKFNFFAAHKNTIDSKSDEIITENDMAFKEFVI